MRMWLAVTMSSAFQGLVVRRVRCLTATIDDWDYLRLNDDALLRQCRVDYRRDSGPGGQKRNKVESAVRLTHEPTGVVANAADERSQHKNKAIALKRLRKVIAHKVRTSEYWDLGELPDELRALLPWESGNRIGRKSELRPLAEQRLLDVFETTQGSLADTARALGGTTGQLSKLLTADDDLFGAANGIRTQHGLSPLRRRSK